MQFHSGVVAGGGSRGLTMLNGFDVPDYPFKNFLKMAASAGSQNGTYAFPPILDANGYPTSVPGNATQFQVPIPSTYAGTWRIYWTQKFKLNLSLGGGVFTIVNNPAGAGTGSGTSNLTITASSDSYVDFTVSGGVTIITFQFFGPGTFTSGIQVVLCRTSAPYAGDQAAIDGGVLTEQFNDDFIAAVRTVNPKIIRPIVANNPDNQQNYARWKYRRPVTALSYISNYWYAGSLASDSGSGAMKTLNTGDAYSITSYPDMPGSWTDGETIQLQWSAANTTTTPTLDVGGRGAKTILAMGASAVSAGTLAANALGTLVYDGVLDALLYNSGGIREQWPTEMLCALANKLNTDIHLQIPTHFDLPSTQSWAANIRDNLNPTLTLEPEYSNEVWNFAFGFEQTSWAAAYGAVLGFPNANGERHYGTYALRVAQFMPAIATVWTANGRSRSTLRCVLAFQAFSGSQTLAGAPNKYRFQGADLSTSLGYTGYDSIVGVDYNTFPNRPVDVVDVLAYATYYSGAQCVNFDGNFSNTGNGMNLGGPTTGISSPPWTTGLLGAADAYASGDPTNIADALAFLDWDFRQGVRNGSAGSQTLLALASMYTGWETIISSYDGNRPAGRPNLEVECYEGGLEAWYPSTSRCTAIGISTAYGGATGTIANLVSAYKNSLLFRTLVTDQFSQFKAAHASRTATPAWFIFNQLGAQWSMYPGDLYTTAYQSYTAVAQFNN